MSEWTDDWGSGTSEKCQERGNDARGARSGETDCRAAGRNIPLNTPKWCGISFPACTQQWMPIRSKSMALEGEGASAISLLKRATEDRQKISDFDGVKNTVICSALIRDLWPRVSRSSAGGHAADAPPKLPRPEERRFMLKQVMITISMVFSGSGNRNPPRRVRQALQRKPLRMRVAYAGGYRVRAASGDSTKGTQ